MKLQLPVAAVAGCSGLLLPLGVAPEATSDEAADAPALAGNNPWLVAVCAAEAALESCAGSNF